MSPGEGATALRVDSAAQTIRSSSAPRAATEEAPDAPLWYAIWTHSQCEVKVEEALLRKQFEVLLPRVRIPSRRRDRHVMLVRPLFPGYLFLRVAPSHTAYIDVAKTEGVVRMIGERWDLPHAIPAQEIEAIRRLVLSGERISPAPWIRVGDRVRIIAGTLVDLEGFVQTWRASRATFVVSVDLLQRSVALEVPSDLLVRI
jgi:transcription termination/antitermination protein NusG